MTGLTASGQEIVAQGSPEQRLAEHLAQLAAPAPVDELKQLFSAEDYSRGWGQLMKLKLVELNKADQTVQLKAGAAPPAQDTLREELRALQEAGQEPSAAEMKVWKRNKWVQTNKQIFLAVATGSKFSPEGRKKLLTTFTPEMRQVDEKTGRPRWEEAEFKEFNWESKGEPLEPGCLHPLMRVREEFRNILIGMGFEEMPTNNFVESSFWNFDALFQPQQHPARDAHDTFFCSHPALSQPPPNRMYLGRVRDMHEHGGDSASIGYRYNWSEQESLKNILRTHTTAVSARILYKLAREGKYRPARYFSIDRVFRNETLDPTHLAEFHQVEGLVIAKGLTLGHLVGTIQTFFKAIGISDVRFKPAYNPYTEPSMEIFGYSAELGKWIEVGNSGMFRPEMLLPMGFPKDVRVIAWGLSLERPTMIKFRSGNIRELFGHKVRVPGIEAAPLVRYLTPAERWLQERRRQQWARREAASAEEEQKQPVQASAAVAQA